MTLRRQIAAVAVPGAGLILLAFFVVLYEVDRYQYNHILVNWGIYPFRYPFVDWEYIGAAAECWKHGVNVYMSNPCDILDRPQPYSPLWLRATFVPTGELWRNVGGITLDVAFLLSLGLVFKPANWRELALFALACGSTMVVFALERCNVDLLLFLMVLAAGILMSGKLGSRFVAYALLLLAGLLKYYPLVALITALRERPAAFIVVGLTSAAVVFGFVHVFGDEIAAMSRNIPTGRYNLDLFGAENFPRGLGDALILLSPRLQKSSLVAWVEISIAGVLLVFTGFQALTVSRDACFRASVAGLGDRERNLLTLGCAIIVGCFFAGQSIEYRGVYLILIVAGFMGIRRSSVALATRWRSTQVIAIIILLMWEGLFRRNLMEHHAWIWNSILWPIRELLWWYLVGWLLGVLAIFGTRSDTLIAVMHWRPKRLAIERSVARGKRGAP